MKRRDFCRSALAAGMTAAVPGGYTLAAALDVADLPAITSSGAETSIEAAAVKELAGGLRGPLLMSGDVDYDHARAVWNGMIDRKPALIARCEGASDVSNAITFARERDLLVAVRGGGHSISGKAVPEGGLMIDMVLTIVVVGWIGSQGNGWRRGNLERRQFELIAPRVVADSKEAALRAVSDTGQDED